MTTHHQRYPAGESVGYKHGANCATDAATGPNRAKFTLTMSETPRWDTGRVTVETEVTLPGMAARPGRPFGIYVHVPFCATRCGYCDFNTYTPAELGGANPEGWLAALRTELRLAAAHLDAVPGVQTVFVGGGTPSLLGAAGLAAVLESIRDHFTLAPDAEVTTESNPESTSPEFFARLRAAGFTRLSLGMQSTAPHVLAALDRVHSPGRALDAAREARVAGFDHVSIDLIYGTPGETDDDLLRSADAAIDTGVDHLSAYALVVEDGTALARRVRRGEMPAPDDDVLARRYELLDRRLADGGLRLVRGVELGPFRRAVPAQCRLLGRRRMVGRRPRRARLRRLHPVVECQAPQGLCRRAGGWQCYPSPTSNGSTTRPRISRR